MGGSLAQGRTSFTGSQAEQSSRSSNGGNWRDVPLLVKTLLWGRALCSSGLDAHLPLRTKSWLLRRLNINLADLADRPLAQLSGGLKKACLWLVEQHKLLSVCGE